MRESMCDGRGRRSDGASHRSPRSAVAAVGAVLHSRHAVVSRSDPAKLPVDGALAIRKLKRNSILCVCEIIFRDFMFDDTTL